MELGYTLMGEEHGPRELVEIAVQAEARGFDFLAASDHFHPWVPEQTHSPAVWSVLGAVAQATDAIGLQTLVTCPYLRYHPAIVAQSAATIACLSGGRFRLGVGAGERLNEHVVGRGWPAVEERHLRLREALEAIRLLWSGGYQSYRGEFVTVEDARIFDLPDRPIPVAVAASGDASLQLAIDHGDELVATEPLADLVAGFRDAKGAEAPALTQIPVSWAATKDAGRENAHRYFRWSALGWKVQAELPNPVNFDAASQTVRPEDLDDSIPSGPDVEPYVQAVERARAAGFDRICFVQIGSDQDGFFDFWERELRPALAAAASRR
jgi:G6PDH family F420-dependent oxidoreductase